MTHGRDPRHQRWRRYFREALTERLLEGGLSLSECKRRARISASLRLRAWDRRQEAA